MHKFGFIASIFLLINFSACGNVRDSSVSATETEAKVLSPIEVGAAQLSDYLPLLKGKRVAMMVNQTSTIGQTHVVDTLLQWGVNIVKIFAPEHGFRGDHSAGAHVSSTVDEKTGIAIASLYGKSRKPGAEMLKGIDVIIFDIQDVGVRFYTYISSMHYLMEACSEHNIEMMVLDRPNPNGHYVDGPVLDIKYKSFIGMHPVPLVHGMTVGEFATMINGENWLSNQKPCQLTVIKCKNYSHDSLYKLPIRPSPNLPTMASIYLYPSLGLFEGTNVSIGRGTDLPFESVGRPHQKEGSYSFVPRSIPGVADNPKHLGDTCNGMVLTQFANTYILNEKRIYLEWLKLFYKTNKTNQNGAYFKGFFTKLAGTTELQRQIEADVPTAEIYASWEEDLVKFKKMRAKYVLY